jgi:twinkle protein
MALQFSLDMAHSGVNTLWGSFEVKNTRLMKKMLQQFAGKPLEAVAAAARDGLEALMDRFEQLPLYFMGFHGGTDVDQVLEAMVSHSTRSDRQVYEYLEY